MWFGLDDPSVAMLELPHAADARTCPRCGASLVFDAVYVGHDGVYRCPNGDFARPAPDLAATHIELNGFDSLAMGVSGVRIELPLGGLYNCYNALAAFAAGDALGLDPAFIADRFRLVLSKNPAGFNETLRTAVDLAGGRNFLIGLNDRRADGTDVSWIWDVDFERLDGRAHVVVPAGNRAYDLAVRLKYAGVAATAPEPDPAAAMDALIKATPQGETAHLLCTYTAMLDLRAELVRRGWAKPYWET